MMLSDFTPFEDTSDLYFKDFVNIICNNETSAENTSVLSYIFKCKLGKENTLNPTRLHIFWWENASSTLAAFQLILKCPSIINEIIMDDDKIYTENLEEYIVNEISSLMLEKISNGQEIIELQREVRNALNLCEKLSNFNKTESFRLLQICNDLLSTDLIPLNIIKQVIEIKAKDGEGMFSAMFIFRVFKILNDVKNIE